MAYRVSVNLSGLAQGKIDKISDAWGFTTKQEIEDYLENHFIAETKARLVYKAKGDKAEEEKDLTFE